MTHQIEPVKLVLRLLAWALLLASISHSGSFAGIRGVLGGGGAAEMITLKELRDLPSLILAAEGGVMELEGSKRIVEFVKAHGKDLSRTLVEFAPVGSELAQGLPTTSGFKWRQKTEDEPWMLLISSQRLYDSDTGLPLDARRLASVALEAVGTLAGLEDPELSNATRELKGRLPDTLLSTRVSSLLLHVLGWGGEDGSLRPHGFLVESAVGTKDVTAELERPLRCGAGERLQWLSADSLRGSGQGLVIHLAWRCGQQRFRGLGMAHLVGDTLDWRIADIEEIPSNHGGACGDLLGGP